MTAAIAQVLEMVCTDLQCYGEGFVTTEGITSSSCIFYGRNERIPDDILQFSLSVSSETYADDVGLPGTCAIDSSYQIIDLKMLSEDHYVFNSGGPRLAASVRIFHTAVTIPIRRLQWCLNTEKNNFSSIKLGSCFRYRENPVVGVIVLYFERSPKLLSELRDYLDSVTAAIGPFLDLHCQRQELGTNAEETVERNESEPASYKARKDRLDGEKEKRELVVAPCPPPAEACVCSAPAGDFVPMNTTDHEAATENPHTQEEHATQLQRMLCSYWAWGKGYLHKWSGGEPNMPPRVDFRLSCAAFVGCFVTIAVWQNLSDAINRNFSFEGIAEPMVLPASAGALCTLLFALPIVPFAQPRIVILAHTYAIAIAVALVYIFDACQLVWLQKALALSLAVSGMAKLGIIHPPAGATALLLVSFADSASFSQAGMLFFIVSVYLGCAIAITVAVLVQNVLDGRRYPLYW